MFSTELLVAGEALHWTTEPPLHSPASLPRAGTPHAAPHSYCYNYLKVMQKPIQIITRPVLVELFFKTFSLEEKCFPLKEQVLLLSSLIYFAEKEGGRGKSWTFMESFWFGLMALTSVGNGEKKPNTVIGKVKGASKGMRTK